MEDIIAEHGRTIAMAVGAAVVLFILVKVFLPKKKVFLEEMTLNVKCPGCRWQGTVTKYNQTCPKCGSKGVQAL